MSSNNHPERFPTDAEFTARNNRVASLISKFKAEPGYTARPTYLMMPYDRITGFLMIGAAAYGAFHLTRVVYTMFKQGIAVNGHPSERH